MVRRGARIEVGRAACGIRPGCKFESLSKRHHKDPFRHPKITQKEVYGGDVHRGDKCGVTARAVVVRGCVSALRSEGCLVKSVRSRVMGGMAKRRAAPWRGDVAAREFLGRLFPAGRVRSGGVPARQGRALERGRESAQ